MGKLHVCGNNKVNTRTFSRTQKIKYLLLYKNISVSLFLYHNENQQLDEVVVRYRHCWVREDVGRWKGPAQTGGKLVSRSKMFVPLKLSRNIEKKNSSCQAGCIWMWTHASISPLLTIVQLNRWMPIVGWVYLMLK